MTDDNTSVTGTGAISTDNAWMLGAIATLRRNQALDALFPAEDKIIYSNGVRRACMQIENLVAQRHGRKEWYALGFAKDNIVDRIIVPNQTIAAVFFSSVVEGSKREGQEMSDAIQRAKTDFGPDYNLATLLHSHHEIGICFSTHGPNKNDFDGFRNFLGYIEKTREGSPVEFSLDSANGESHDIRIEGKTLTIFPKHDPRKVLLEITLDLDKLSTLGDDPEKIRQAVLTMASGISQLSYQQKYLIRDGFSVVLDRQDRWLAHQGYLAEISVTGGNYLFKERPAKIDFADVPVGRHDIILPPAELEDIVTNRLHLPKPQPAPPRIETKPPTSWSFSFKPWQDAMKSAVHLGKRHRGGWDLLMEKFSSRTPARSGMDYAIPSVTREKTRIIEDARWYARFAATVVTDFDMFDSNMFSYITFMSNTMGRILNNGAGLSGAIALEYTHNDNTLPKDYSPIEQPMIGAIHIENLGWNMFQRSMERPEGELDFVKSYCNSSMYKRDKVLEKYVRRLVESRFVYEYVRQYYLVDRKMPDTNPGKPSW